MTKQDLAKAINDAVASIMNIQRSANALARKLEMVRDGLQFTKEDRSAPRQPSRQKPADPLEDTIEPDGAVAEFLDYCDSTCEEADEVMEENEASVDFAESVKERVTAIRQTVESKQMVTEKQKTAVTNMADGLARWRKS